MTRELVQQLVMGEHCDFEAVTVRDLMQQTLRNGLLRSLPTILFGFL
jgi:hypothetical protein